MYYTNIKDYKHLSDKAEPPASDVTLLQALTNTMVVVAIFTITLITTA